MILETILLIPLFLMLAGLIVGFLFFILNFLFYDLFGHEITDIRFIRDWIEKIKKNLFY